MYCFDAMPIQSETTRQGILGELKAKGRREAEACVRCSLEAFTTIYALEEAVASTMTVKA